MTDNSNLETIRALIRARYLADEAEVVADLAELSDLSATERAHIAARAEELVKSVRSSSTPTLIENFLGEYGLSTKEGVALMCLAEALLRVPDAETIDALIEDKLTPGQWSAHLGRSSSTLVNASTWALMLTGKVLSRSEEGGLADALREMVKNLGEPVVRTAVAQAMRELGRQFVHGRTIDEAIKNAKPLEKKGYCYSYDMLGEAARTEADARRYHLDYADAISSLAPACSNDQIWKNPGISVKLSALHARYEFGQRGRVVTELVSRTRSLALLAKSANMGFNIDAEEADRLDLSLDVIEAVLSDPALSGWDGFGVVVQAFGPRAATVLDWLYALAVKLERRIMVRLVKGAYWDTEIKRAQVLGLSGYPVFTRKVNTDVSYIACARKLLAMTDRIYPQFATHNAHSVASVLEMAKDRSTFEFQRLHGMGESLHESVRQNAGTRCRIYAPVGAHRDLLAYLVRRLLENGANSSFVNQIVDESIPPEQIARDPLQVVESLGGLISNPRIPRPSEIFGSGRANARGWDITDSLTIAELDTARGRFEKYRWEAGPIIAGQVQGTDPLTVINPARPYDEVGRVVQASDVDVQSAITAARTGFAEWNVLPVTERAARLCRVGELYERNAPELFALLTREAGKTMLDCVGEVREAVDFSRYYGTEAIRQNDDGTARGVIVCISPWNFPIAIFSGQILAALAAGNAVIAKPAEQTPLIAARAVSLMHEAGIPVAAIQLLPGGSKVGAALTASPDIDGVCFTGSTETAQIINRSMATSMAPDVPLVAETGGLNAMIVDSTALPEQAVRDIVASAFQSAGQRCSALRILYVQVDVADRFEEMLLGALDELRVGDPWHLSTDVGPVIDTEARDSIDAYCAAHTGDGHLVKRLAAPGDGIFVAPTVLRVDGIDELEREVFGPVLHLATYKESEIDKVLDAINAKGYGLTFGLHTRIDNRVQQITDRIAAGNLYVNRNQIGAVVGSQPFGGEGLSGTGPKAGGPLYVRRFMRTGQVELAGRDQSPAGVQRSVTADALQEAIDAVAAQERLQIEDRLVLLRSALGADAGLLDAAAEFQQDEREMPGPTGEANLLSVHPRGIVVCAGPSEHGAVSQALQALLTGNGAVVVMPGAARLMESWSRLPVVGVDGNLVPSTLSEVNGYDAVASTADGETLSSIRRALAARTGAIVPLITEGLAPERYVIERHLCIDTTASGGNASLLASVES